MVDAPKGFSTKFEFRDARDARHELQLLSASDPAAAANMARHSIAAGMLVTGARADDRSETEAHFLSGFILTRGEGMAMMAAANRIGGSHVYLAFDMDDALGPPLAIGVFRVEGEQVATYPLCGIWSPAGGGRSVVVPYGEGAPRCHFVARRGQPLARIEGLPEADLEAGLRRGARRLGDLVRSAALKDAHVGAYCSIIQTRKGGFDVKSQRLAA